MAPSAVRDSNGKVDIIGTGEVNERLSHHISHSKIVIRQLEALESIIDPDTEAVVCNGHALSLAAIVAVSR